MNRDLVPTDLLPAIANVAGALVVNLVVAESARMAAERECAELREVAYGRPMPAPAEQGPAEAWRPSAAPADWRNGSREAATSAGETP